MQSQEMASETIGPDLVSSIRYQSLTEKSEAGEEPVKLDRTGSFCNSLATLTIML